MFFWTDEANSTNMAEEVNCIVLGGGSGGMGSARRAVRYTDKVVLVEKQIRLGGTCVNVGCVPKKVMFNASAVKEALGDAKGYCFNAAENVTLDYPALKAKRDAYIKRLNGIYEANLERDKVQHVKGTFLLNHPNCVRRSQICFFKHCRS